MGCGFVVSEDLPAGQDLEGVRVVNPFETRPADLSDWGRKAELKVGVGPERMPAVIFVTAYDQFAVLAFEVNAAQSQSSVFNPATRPNSDTLCVTTGAPGRERSRRSGDRARRWAGPSARGRGAIARRPPPPPGHHSPRQSLRGTSCDRDAGWPVVKTTSGALGACYTPAW